MRKRRNEFAMSRSALQSIVFTLVILLFADPIAFAAHKAPPKDVLTQVTALGVGHWAVVWLKHGHQLKGTIAGIDATSFTLDRGGNHGTETLTFADVSKVQKSGLTTGDKVAIGVFGVMVAGAVIAVLAIKSEGSGSFGNLGKL